MLKIITTALTTLLLSSTPTLAEVKSPEGDCLKFYRILIKPVVSGRDAGTHPVVLQRQLEMIGAPPPAAYSIIYNVFVVYKDADEPKIKEVFMDDCAGEAL